MLYRTGFRLFFVLCFTALFALPLSAQGSAASHVNGNWFAYEKGLDAVIVRLYQKNGMLHGVITHTFGEIPKRCGGCHGTKHNRRIIGMQLLKGMVWKQGKWRGKALYPAQGRWYPCALWKKGSKLIVEVRYGGQRKILRIRRYRL